MSIDGMIHRSEMTKRNAIVSLASQTCPACAGPKKERMSLCGACYHQLPAHYQRALYKRIGEGYGQALWDALVLLDAEKFHLPDGATEP
jgi:hypothetical protein